MERWLRITENPHGEWSVLDLERNYRICSFNHGAHGGEHVHHERTTKRVAVGGLETAKQVARAYAEQHDKFEMKAFEGVLRRWKSEPSAD